VDQSSPNFFRPTPEETLSVKYFSGDIRAQSEKVSEIGPNLVFFAPKIFLVVGPKFSDWHL